MLGLNRPEIEKLLAGTTAGAWAAHDGDLNDDLTYRGFPWIEREPTGAPGDDGDLLATCSNPGDARLMAAAPELARQCLALLDRAEAAERDRDAARRKGAEEERGRIVKRLRYEADNPSHSARTGVAIDNVASAIERGHLEAPMTPDLSDPASLGCLLALVREAWGDPTAMVSAVKDADGSVSHWICYVFPCEDREARFPATIEPAALVAALEAAPRRTT
jgi:hypothetical protein